MMNIARKTTSGLYGRALTMGIHVVQLCQACERGPALRRRLGKKLLDSATQLGTILQEARLSTDSGAKYRKLTDAVDAAADTLYWLDILTAGELLGSGATKSLIRECEMILAALESAMEQRRMACTPALN